jgi:hypothetical protein
MAKRCCQSFDFDLKRKMYLIIVPEMEMLEMLEMLRPFGTFFRCLLKSLRQEKGDIWDINIGHQ